MHKLYIYNSCILSYHLFCFLRYFYQNTMLNFSLKVLIILVLLCGFLLYLFKQLYSPRPVLSYYVKTIAKQNNLEDIISIQVHTNWYFVKYQLFEVIISIQAALYIQGRRSVRRARGATRKVRALVSEGEPKNWGLGCIPEKFFGAAPFRLA